MVTVDKPKRSIIIRTTNKKYYKEIHIPELSRCNLLPQQDAVSIVHQHNTLVIIVSILFDLLFCKLFKNQKFFSVCEAESRLSNGIGNFAHSRRSKGRTKLLNEKPNE